MCLSAIRASADERVIIPVPFAHVRFLGNALQADLVIHVAEETEAYKLLSNYGTFLKYVTNLVYDLQTMVQVSFAKIVSELPRADGWKFEESVTILGTRCQIMILQAKGKKCPRCWTYTSTREEEPCERCCEVLKGIREKG